MENLGGLTIGLLLLESVLLVVTITLLVFSIKEGRGRNKLIMEVGRVTKILTRYEYFMAVSDSMMDSKKEVIGYITGRMPDDEDKKLTTDVITNIERLVKNGVKVRYMMPKFQDRLHVGWLYTRAGAKVRYITFPEVDDFRYTVIDGNVSIIGVPESIGDEKATKKGYRIPSEGLSDVLKEHFRTCWGESISYREYVKETLEQTGGSPKILSQELRIDEAELKRFA